MSRIGNKPVEVPGGVSVSIDGRCVSIEGPLGKLEFEHRPEVRVEYDEGAKRLVVARGNDERQARAFHGTTRAILQNMCEGVTKGYEKRLEIVGVGYVAAVQNDQLELRVGFANEVHKPIPKGLKVACPDNNHVIVNGCSKQQVGQFSAEVRAVRKPEPYKGKGIRYQNEYVKIKPGKAAT